MNFFSKNRTREKLFIINCFSFMYLILYMSFLFFFLIIEAYLKNL